MIRLSAFSSGLRVVTETMPETRSVSLGFWVAAGSRDEAPAVAGSSHFLEHLLFKGTRTRTAREIAEAFDAVGGDLNAFTSKEYTCFYARVLDRDLPMAVDFLSDMLQDSEIATPDLESERQVILEEINMHEDDPGDLIHDVFTETLWPGHPLGRPVLGTAETIRAATRDRIRRFWKRHYVPGNLVVAAAGNVEHGRLLRLLRRGMDVGERVSPREAPALRKVGSPPSPVGGTIVRRRPTEQAHLVVGTNGIARGDDRRFALGVLNNALGGGMSSRLFQEIREKRGLVYSVYSHHAGYTEAGMFTVYAGTSPGRANEVLRLIRREAEDIAERGLAADEIERAKGHLKGSLVLSLDDPGGRMSRLGKSVITQGDMLSIDELLERTDAVGSAEVAAIADEVLRRPMALAVIGPFDEDAFAEGGAGPKAERPPAKATRERRDAARRP